MGTCLVLTVHSAVTTLCRAVTIPGHVFAAQVDKARLQAANEAILAKVQLSTTVISDSKYAELKQIPADQRSLADEVKLVIHEGLKQAKQENEQLRLEAQVLSSSSETCKMQWHCTVCP